MILGSLAQFAAATCKGSFFGLPTWYKYLELNNKCQIVNFQVPGDLILVVLAIIDILLRFAGLAAVIYVVYGGIQYVTSQGNPDATAKAQSSILNALIGLAIALIAVAFVSYLGTHLGN